MDTDNPQNKELSKYQFVILAAKRAKQLLKGARPKIKTKSRNPIRIAQQEVQMGLIDFETIAIAGEKEELEAEEQVIVADEHPEELEGIPSLASLEEEEEGLTKLYEESEEAEEEEELDLPEKESDEEE